MKQASLTPSVTTRRAVIPAGGSLSGAMLEALRQIATLQDAVGSHACECGHPEMRVLPDGVFHCPACGCEVLPLAASKGKSARAAAGGRCPR